jgi:hypothetical protein
MDWKKAPKINKNAKIQKYQEATFIVDLPLEYKDKIKYAEAKIDNSQFRIPSSVQNFFRKYMKEDKIYEKREKIEKIVAKKFQTREYLSGKFPQVLVDLIFSYNIPKAKSIQKKKKDVLKYVDRFHSVWNNITFVKDTYPRFKIDSWDNCRTRYFLFIMDCKSARRLKYRINNTDHFYQDLGAFSHFYKLNRKGASEEEYHIDDDGYLSICFLVDDSDE